MFEAQDQWPAGVVIRQGRPRTVEPWRRGMASAADAVDLGAFRQQPQTATPTNRRRDEREFRPALRTQRLGRRRLSPARETARRNQKIKRRPKARRRDPT